MALPRRLGRISMVTGAGPSPRMVIELGNEPGLDGAFFFRFLLTLLLVSQGSHEGLR